MRPAVHRTYYDGDVSHVTGIVTISRSEFEAMPPSFDGAYLREQFPNFGQAKILSIRVMRDDWPAQRSCAGYDLPRETGIDGLWCVGDAVKQYGNGGTQACAETAKIVTDAILAQRPRMPQPSRA